MEDFLAWPLLEIRQEGRTLRGRFPYNRLAVTSDRGSVRKERIRSRAFRFAVESDEREIHLLIGHDYSQPIARKLNSSLKLRETDDALESWPLPSERDRPTYLNDLLGLLRSGLVGGISPGFRVPPTSVVPNSESLTPEPGNPGVSIREVNEAVLYELSLVTRPAYDDTDVEVRARTVEPEIMQSVANERERLSWLL